MIDPKEFLQNVLTSNDDQSRLVYADWLEERGDLGRADLIRTQCAIASSRPWERAAVDAGFRAAAVLAEHGSRLRAELPQLPGVTWTDFERGFPSTVRVNEVSTLYRHAAEIGAAAPVYRAHLEKLEETEPYIAGSVPWLRTLRITSTNEVAIHPESSILKAPVELEIVGVEEYHLLEWLTGSERVGKLERLHVEGMHVIGRRFIDELAMSAWAKQLRSLAIGTRFVDYDSGYFQDPTLGEEGGTVLTTFGRLEVLDISRQRVRANGLQRVIEELPGLRELDARAAEAVTISHLEHARGTPLVRVDLSHNAFGDVGARVLAKAPRLATLESLQLDTCELGVDGVRALVDAPFWSTLRVLDLSRNALGYEAVRALVDAPAPAALHTLLLADTELTPSGIETLLAIPWIRQLLVLDLSSNPIPPCTAALTGLAGGSLKKLALSKCELGDVSALAPVWSQLVELDLSLDPIGDAGIEALANGAAPELQSLDLASCGLTGAGFRHLCKAAMPRLRALDIHDNELAPDSLAVLLRESALAPQLEALDMSHTKQDPSVADDLATSTRIPRLRTLTLRNVLFTEAQMLSLARSDKLHSLEQLKLTVDVWSFPKESRDELFARFKGGWWYYEEEEPS